MRKFLTQYRAPLRFTLALLPVAAAAGYLVIRYQLALYDPATLAAMLAQLGSTAVLLAVGTAQTVVYAAVCGFFGYLLAEKLGLMRPFRLEKRPLLRTLAVSLPLGLLFSLDYWTFGVWLPGTAVQTSAASGCSAATASAAPSRWVQTSFASWACWKAAPSPPPSTRAATTTLFLSPTPPC